jgi:hypothetical protein
MLLLDAERRPDLDDREVTDLRRLPAHDCEVPVLDFDPGHVVVNKDPGKGAFDSLAHISAASNLYRAAVFRSRAIAFLPGI